jgi:hypothetical protein
MNDSLSSKLGEAIGPSAGPSNVPSIDEETRDMVDRAANAAEMGVRICFLSPVDPSEAAAMVAKRKGAVVVEHVVRGKARAATVSFPNGGVAIYTRSRMQAKVLGADEFLLDEG